MEINSTTVCIRRSQSSVFRDQCHERYAFASREDYRHYLEAKRSVDELSMFIQSLYSVESERGLLSKTMQQRVFRFLTSQIAVVYDKRKPLKAAKAIGNRCIAELLTHLLPKTSSRLWTALRANRCDFIGPAAQNEVLKLVLLRLEDGSCVSRPELANYVMRYIPSNFTKVTKSHIGSVLQLLYRAQCFQTYKGKDAYLLQLKEDFRTYDALREQHDTEIVSLGASVGFFITAEQWSFLLFNDLVHRSYMQVVINKQPSTKQFNPGIEDLNVVLNRCGNPGNLRSLIPYLEILEEIDIRRGCYPSTWNEYRKTIESTVTVIKSMVEYVQRFGNKMLLKKIKLSSSRYKSKLCESVTLGKPCPHGMQCTFAHSIEERNKFNTPEEVEPVSRMGGSIVSDANGNSSLTHFDNRFASETDEEIPFDPPYQSKYGPISRDCRSSDVPQIQSVSQEQNSYISPLSFGMSIFPSLVSMDESERVMVPIQESCSRYYYTVSCYYFYSDYEGYGWEENANQIEVC